MSATELVTVSIGAGGSFTSWTSVEIRRAVKEAAASFTLKAAQPVGAAAQPPTFTDFMPLTISSQALAAGVAPGLGGGDLMVTGYIDSRKIEIGPQEAAIEISGRSKAQDSVDCSAVHPTGSFQQQTPLAVAQAIDIYGVGYSADAQMDPIDHQLTPGETVHREVERLCRDAGLSLFGQPDGSVKLWSAATSAGRNGPVIEGQNLYKGSSAHNCENRHSHTHVRGHSTKGTGKQVHQIESIATDDGVPRTRHRVHIHDSDTDQTRAQKRAEAHRDRAAGNGLKATVTMVGWRDDGGQLWTPGNLVWFESPTLDVIQDMLIESVTYKQDAGGSEEEGGTEADLELVDPRAYAGAASARSNSGSSWNIDNSAAS